MNARDKTFFQYRCERCGHKWLPRTADPVRCPRCTSIHWHTPKRAKKKEGPNGT